VRDDLKAVAGYRVLLRQFRIALSLRPEVIHRNTSAVEHL
jgi:hypothetical protein